MSVWNKEGRKQKLKAKKGGTAGDDSCPLQDEGFYFTPKTTHPADTGGEIKI